MIFANACFLTNDSAEEIQNKIEYLIDNSNAYKEMKKVAIEQGMEKFSYQKIAKQSVE